MGAPPLNAGHSNPAQARLGRFLSRDPIGFSGGLNLYGYVGGNPVNAVDPSGLDEVYYLLTGAGPSNGYRGHSAVYIEGAGVFNFSTAGSGHDIGEGVSLDSFIDENLYRGVDVYKVPVTPLQKRIIAGALKHTDAKVDSVPEVWNYAAGRTCGRVLDNAFVMAGVIQPSESGRWDPQHLRQKLIDEAGAHLVKSVPATPTPNPVVQAIGSFISNELRNGYQGIPTRF